MPFRPRRKFGASQKHRIFLSAYCRTTKPQRRFTGVLKHFKTRAWFTGNLILPEHLHVTLFHLGDWAALPDEIVRLAIRAASQMNVQRSMYRSPVPKCFRNSTGIFPFVLTGDKNPSVWSGLHDALRAELIKTGLGGATKGEFLRISRSPTTNCA